MRSLLFALLMMLAAAPAFGQALGTGIPMNQEKQVSPEEAAKRRATEEAYKNAIKQIPEGQKANDPWGNMRTVGTPNANPKGKAAAKKAN